MCEASRVLMTAGQFRIPLAAGSVPARAARPSPLQRALPLPVPLDQEAVVRELSLRIA